MTKPHVMVSSRARRGESELRVVLATIARSMPIKVTALRCIRTPPNVASSSANQSAPTTVSVPETSPPLVETRINACAEAKVRSRSRSAIDASRNLSDSLSSAARSASCSRTNWCSMSSKNRSHCTHGHYDTGLRRRQGYSHMRTFSFAGCGLRALLGSLADPKNL